MREEILAGDSPNQIIVKQTEDLTKVRDYARDINYRGHAGWSPTREMKLAATFPTFMLKRWAQEDGILGSFLQMPKKEFFEWARKKCIQHDCTDFLVTSEESFRVNLNQAKAVATKRKFIIP